MWIGIRKKADLVTAEEGIPMQLESVCYVGGK